MTDNDEARAFAAAHGGIVKDIEHVPEVVEALALDDLSGQR